MALKLYQEMVSIMVNKDISATYKSKKTLDKRPKYAKYMVNGYSIRKSAKVVEINVAHSYIKIKDLKNSEPMYV